jgi:1,4-dihydroxy-2-naphthoate octaprenyltransferase
MAVTAVLQAMRLPFVMLSPVCVFLGLSVALYEGVSVNYLYFALAMLGAVLGHISVNCLNEHADFSSGLDLNTQKTPFSGGSGALPANPSASKAVFYCGIVCLLVTMAIGVYFIAVYGLALLPLGLLGVALILTYTGWVNKHALLCLIAPGVGFGPLMVGGTYFVLSGGYSPLLWLVSLLPFFLVNNLLLLNQYPDIAADAGAGRRHLLIRYGVPAANGVYALFALATVAVLLLGVYLSSLPTLALLALLPLPLALFSLSGAVKYGAALGHHPQYLAANVILTLLLPLLLALTLLYSL